MSDCYDEGDPKAEDYREPAVCVYCSCIGGHYDGCQVAPR